MQAFLEYVVKGLVQNPDAVSITPVERGGMTVYELRLDPSDVGKIIGRQGITINAIRSLLLAGSAAVAGPNAGGTIWVFAVNTNRVLTNLARLAPAVERELVIQALKETDGNQLHAAKLLGITRKTASALHDYFAAHG